MSSCLLGVSLWGLPNVCQATEPLPNASLLEMLQAANHPHAGQTLTCQPTKPEVDQGWASGGQVCFAEALSYCSVKSPLLWPNEDHFEVEDLFGTLFGTYNPLANGFMGLYPSV